MMARADHTGHPRDHHRVASKRALMIVLGLLATHMVVEIAGSIISGSLGLLAHATHILTDMVAICLALFALRIAERPATITRTFGFQRIEVLVVMLNALALWVLASRIAYLRFTKHAQGHHHEVEGGVMATVRHRAGDPHCCNLGTTPVVATLHQRRGCLVERDRRYDGRDCLDDFWTDRAVFPLAFGRPDHQPSECGAHNSELGTSGGQGIPCAAGDRPAAPGYVRTVSCPGGG